MAGLSSANRLRSAGHEVHVFEANDYVGGKLHSFETAGYRFDAGPSLFTMPQLLDEVFHEAGRNPRDYYTYQKIDPACHYFWEDGSNFEAPGDTDRFAEAAAQTFGVDASRLRDYFERSAEIYDITEDVFLKSSLHKLSTYLKSSTLRSMMSLHKARIFSTMHAVNADLMKHDKLTQLFDRYATYNGSNPYKAPGTLTVIPTLEHRWGTFLPEGGMHEISKSLYKLALDQGVVFHLGDSVSEIVLDGKTAAGLQSKSGSYSFDAVVSNADVVPTYKHLLPNTKLPQSIARQERSSSALIFYWGVSKEFEHMGLHNIFWSEHYKEEFEYLFEKKELHSDPTVYVNITSKYVAEDAPEGCENWFVMVNAPHVAGQDWEALREKARSSILSKLNRILGCNMEAYIACERVLDPPGIESQSASHLGSLYGSSSNSRFSAFLRHPNFSQKLKNLYFCGGSVHPGGGIPLCLLSGKIVSDLIS